jgi:hypothetical protein
MLSVPVPAAARSTACQSSRIASGTPVVVSGSNMVPRFASPHPFTVPLWELNSPNSRAASGWAATSCIG